jgi:hypothetical protein
MGSAVPDMQLMSHILILKKAAQMTIVVEERVGIPDGENDIDLPQSFKLPFASEPRKEMAWRMEVDRVIVIAVEQVSKALDLHRQVVSAGKGDEFSK